MEFDAKADRLSGSRTQAEFPAKSTCGGSSFLQECLQCVLEVVELGISGTKSQRKASVAPVYKQDKELKPASKRVKDAAEGLLACLLNHVVRGPW